MLGGYRKIVRFRVPFSDIDMMRHVNNAVYARWAELTRSDYLVDVIGADIAGGTGMILARLEIDYLHPVFYRENVAIGCRVSRIGTKSFDFTAEVWSEDRKERCAHMLSMMVAMDYERNVSIPVPSDWREKIGAFEIVPVASIAI